MGTDPAAKPSSTPGSAPTSSVSGGRGVVVGNYGNVFQSFGQAAVPLASLIRTGQFSALVDERTRHFVGREFVFEALDRQLAGAEFESGYVVVRGEPGIGKSSIAASLVLRGAHVHHFNIAAANIRTPRQFLENVCAQLVVRYALPYAGLPPGAGEDGGFLSQLLAEAAQVARARNELPLVVVVDAIDEAERNDLGADANRLYLPRTLPPGVFFVLTAREEADYRLDVDHEAEIWIRDDDERNLSDVLQYVRAFVTDHGDAMRSRIAGLGLDEDGFVDEVVSRSEGNFMYLVHVLPDILHGRLALEGGAGVTSLPRGLESYYRVHWRAMKNADERHFTTRQRPVLAFLAISRAPVTVRQLADWAGLEPSEVKRVVQDWREFLNEEAVRPPRYRIYHRSFAEFLDEEEDLRWYHDKIAQAALAKIPGFLS